MPIKSVIKGKTFIAQLDQMFLSNIHVDALAKDFGVIAAIILFLNGFYLSNFSLSIDDELHALNHSYVQWISLGRWTLAALDRWVFPQPVLPVVPFLFFSLCLAASYLLLTLSHQIQQKYLRYFSLPVFILYPIWSFITGFDSTLPGISVGMLSVSLAGFLFSRTHRRSLSQKAAPFIVSILLQAGLLSLAIGAYQSFLLLFIAITSGILLINHLEKEETPRTLLFSLAQVAITCVLGLALYSAMNFMARWVTGIEQSPYLETYYVTRHIKELLHHFASEVAAFYSGNSSRFGASFYASGILVALSIFSVLKMTWKKAWLPRISAVGLWLVVMASPFLLILASIQMTSRSLFTLAYVTWLLTVLILKEKNKLILGVNILVVALLILQAINLQGMYLARSTIVERYDSLLAADIYHRIGSADPNFDRNQITFLDVYGTANFDSIYPKPKDSSIGASFFDWDHGNLDRMVNYMRLLGYLNIRQLPDENRAALSPEFAKMPAWPAEGCVQKVGNAYLVKLSDSPDPVHAQYLTVP